MFQVRTRRACGSSAWVGATWRAGSIALALHGIERTNKLPSAFWTTARGSVVRTTQDDNSAAKTIYDVRARVLRLRAFSRSLIARWLSICAIRLQATAAARAAIRRVDSNARAR